MSVSLVLLAAIVLLAAGYAVYGRLIAGYFRLDDGAPTPAERVNDGADFIPTKPLYLFSQHFSAIAAAGPIAGPILACQQFGWAPCMLWICLGVVFIGAVHDFSALAASVRHGGRSIVEIARENLGRRAGLALTVFIWVSLIYVIVAFTDITAKSFVGRSFMKGTEDVVFEQGGAVAGASTMYLGLAVLMGLGTRFLKMPLWLSTIVFVPATFAVIGLGTLAPGGFTLGEWAGGTDAEKAKTWSMLILAYCFAASLVPLWTLLQPRGYLGGIFLFSALVIGCVGILIGGFDVKQPAFRGWAYEKPGGAGTVLLFPFLFVTIACGACSGFHGLVCSGTTSKQIARESHCRPIGYGAMLGEGVVAVIALATLLIFAQEEVRGAPGTIYGTGLGRFLTAIIGERHAQYATTFGVMAFSTFVFDTLDVCTRLGRYMLQEVFGWQGRGAKAGATLATLAPAAFILYATDKPAAYMDYWTLFGASNQLLAGLTFLGITVWLRRNGRPCWFTFVPMVFMLGVTGTSLVSIARGSFAAWRAGGVGAGPQGVNAAAAALLLALAAVLLVEAARAWRRGESRGSANGIG